MRMRVSCVALALAIGLLAGCGGGGSSSATTTNTVAFKSGFQAATADLKQGAIVIANDVTHASGMTNAQLATIFSTVAAKWQTAASKLDSLHPPASAAADFATVKSATAKVESDLHAVAAAAQSGDVAAAKQATRTLLNDVLATKSAAQKVDTEVGISG
jgi:ABC-type glycerol-3-phosphate transport system substrate-binding protein